MKGKFTPYNAGEVRKINGTKPGIICGHIWWPVEKVNAYHLVYLGPDGEPTGDPQYVWDHSHGGWPLVEAA